MAETKSTETETFNRDADGDIEMAEATTPKKRRNINWHALRNGM